MVVAASSSSEECEHKTADRVDDPSRQQQWSPSSGKLYDREEHLRTLLDSFQAVVDGQQRDNQSKNELVLVTGASGTGKTVLCLELRGTVEEKNGFFVKGKFDQLQATESYAAIIDALTNFSQQYLKRERGGNGNRLQNLKEKVLKATAGQPEVLVQMIPALSVLFQEDAQAN